MTAALDDRLRELGGVLAFDGDDGELIRSVLARVDEPASSSTDRSIDRSAIRPGARSALRIAAVVVALVAAVVAAVPSSRRAVADWFGFDGARLEREPDLSVPAEPDPIDQGTAGTVVDVGADEVLVSEFTGTLDNPALAKVVGDGTRVRRVTVHGELALWIDGEPHEVSFFDESGQIAFRRFAGNTLLWQDGPLIRRLEGFSDVDAAVDYAESFGT